MSRGNQVTRQWTIIQWLDRRRGGMTLDEFSRELNCSPRTVYRDLCDLESVGFPITNELIGGTGYWQFVEGYRSSLPTPFSLAELMSLYLSRDFLKSLEGTFFHESIQNLIAKIRAQLGSELVNFLHSTEQAFAAGCGPAGDYRAHRQVLHLLNDACLKGETVKFLYYSRKHETTTREVDPYKVYYFQGTLYLIGRDRRREAMRIFVIDRIQLLEKSGEKFERDPSFELEGFLKDSFGVMQESQVEVTVRVDAAVARFVAEKRWHESQRVTENGDGSRDFSFKLAGVKEIKIWILGLGPMARVLAPEELVEEIIADLEGMLAKYRAEESCDGRKKREIVA